MAKIKTPIKVKFGKGVLAKDGVTPYAAGTIHATNRFGMTSAYKFCHHAVAALLIDDQIMEIKVIDLDNSQSINTKTWIERSSQDEINQRWDAKA